MKLTTNNRMMMKDGVPFFYLADTCWSAFTSIKEDEWFYYLKKRKEQGFNTLQINILPQWDRSIGEFDQLPFKMKEGIFDFSELDDSYFERARRMCAVAEEQGFVLSLIVLWSNYVTGTWASAINQEKNVYPTELLDKYFEKVIDYFDSFSPIYVIGGDTDFPTDSTIATYQKAFDYFESATPDTIKTIHVKGRFSEIPEAIQKRLDIYFYQSGHNSSFPDMAYTLAQDFYKKEPQLPIINSEPCYEQMGYARKVYGRFRQSDVRKAAWQSVLSGGCAGITYGAHGVWSWHRNSASYSIDKGEAFDTPMQWQDAINFPGALDYGYLKNLLEDNGITVLKPSNHKLEKGDEQIRVAYAEDVDMYLIYLPSNTSIRIAVDFSDYHISLIDLATKEVHKPDYMIKDKQTIFPTHTCLEDVLIIARNK